MRMHDTTRHFSITRRLAVAAVAFLCVASLPGLSPAAPGTLITSVPLAVTGRGVSIAVGCDASPILYYTVLNTNNVGGTVLERMTPGGVNLGGLPILDPSGNPVSIDEMAYDSANDFLWACEHGPTPVRVWKINRTTGLATFAFTSSTPSVGTYRDGITVDNNDNTLFISGDVSNTVEHYTQAGLLLNVLTPTNAAGGILGLISGIQVGVGDLLYLGRNGAGEIVQVKKSDGTFISSFASPGGRDEGLECDPRSFAPTVVMWSRDFNEPGRVDAIEVDPLTCRCGGVTPVRKSTWGALKSIYR